jgi:hypothetical protein
MVTHPAKSTLDKVLARIFENATFERNPGNAREPTIQTQCTKTSPAEQDRRARQTISDQGRRYAIKTRNSHCGRVAICSMQRITVLRHQAQVLPVGCRVHGRKWYHLTSLLGADCQIRVCGAGTWYVIAHNGMLWYLQSRFTPHHATPSVASPSNPR